MSILDFFSNEAGQRRRAELEGLLTQFIPPEMRSRVSLLNELNPVTSIERASQDAQRIVDPSVPAWARVGAVGDMLSNVAGVVAPAMVANRAGIPVANALTESLAGFGGQADDAARYFMADESGALKLTRENAPLIGHHNLSPKGVEVASDIGGIPMPSLAISRADYPLTNFGDVSLLADPRAVTPSRNVGVWPTDVYTGRQPRGELQFANQKAVEKAMRADPAFGHMRDASYWMDATDNLSNAEEMLKTAQLGVKEGIDPKKFESMWDYVRDVRAKMGMELYDKRDAMPGFQVYGDMERVLYPQELFTASGNRRKPAPYTLGSVMDRMAKSRAFEAGSEGFDYGPGSFRAVVTPPFRNMDQISAARGSIVPSSEMASYKKMFEDAFEETLKSVEAVQTSPGWRDAPEAMREIAMGKNPKWFGDVPDAVKENVRALAEAARGLPTEYFEAKPRTAMRLSDFPVALVPEGQPETADLLRASGIRDVLTYGSPEERVELFKRFPGLLFSVAATAGLGAAAIPSETSAAPVNGLLSPEDEIRQYLGLLP